MTATGSPELDDELPLRDRCARVAITPWPAWHTSASLSLDDALLEPESLLELRGGKY